MSASFIFSADFADITAVNSRSRRLCVKFFGLCLSRDVLRDVLTLVCMLDCGRPVDTLDLCICRGRNTKREGGDDRDTVSE